MFKRRTLRTQLLATLVAIVFSLSLISQVSAAVGITNGEFGTYPTCNLGGWTTSGTTYAKTKLAAGLELSNDCVGQAYSTLSAYTHSATSSFKQTFTVSADPIPGSILYQDTLVLTAWGKSSNGYAPNVTPPFGSYLPQRITIYDAAGNIIYSKSRNVSSNTAMRLTYSLKEYRGQNVTVELKTTVGDFYINSPDSASIYADDVHMDVGSAIPNCAACSEW